MEPQEGHGGDILYVSGEGFPAHAKLAFLIGCPDDGTRGTRRLEIGRPGPVLDARGRFSAFPMQALALPRGRSMHCHIYASANQEPYQPTQAPRYDIRAPGSPLSPCATSICLALTQRVNASGPAIGIHGWPAASYFAMLTSRRRIIAQRTGILNWKGNDVWHFPAASFPRHGRLILHITAILGTYSGTRNVVLRR